MIIRKSHKSIETINDNKQNIGILSALLEKQSKSGQMLGAAEATFEIL